MQRYHCSQHLRCARELGPYSKRASKDVDLWRAIELINIRQLLPYRALSDKVARNTLTNGSGVRCLYMGNFQYQRKLAPHRPFKRGIGTRKSENQ